jgi:hypothetical protein
MVHGGNSSINNWSIEMRFKNVTAGLLGLIVLASGSVFAGGSADDSKEARNCISQSGSGKDFAYAYKNPGWDGKRCNTPVNIWACKDDETCSSGKGGYNDKGKVYWNTTYKPGFTPKSSIKTFE